MPFQKNISGNPAGRKPGNKKNLEKQLKDLVQKFCRKKFGDIEFYFEELSPRQKTAFFLKFMEFAISKGNDEVNLTPEQIADIVTTLKAELNPGTLLSLKQGS